MKISEILNIQPGMTALIGGGGKTTLMYRLAEELSAVGTVIICTSTKIIEPSELPVLVDPTAGEIAEALQSRRVLCVGSRASAEKLSAPAIGFSLLKELADYVIVEADGAHRLPVKAHADYEPVIPAATDWTILVVGADAFGRPIIETCHRPELFAEIAGVGVKCELTPGILKDVIIREGYSDYLYINNVEDDTALQNARELAAMLDVPAAAGSLREGVYLCLR